MSKEDLSKHLETCPECRAVIKKIAEDEDEEDEDEEEEE